MSPAPTSKSPIVLMVHQTHIVCLHPTTLKRTQHPFEFLAYSMPATLYRLNVCNLERSVSVHRHTSMCLLCTYFSVSEITWQNQWREMLGLPMDLLRVDEVRHVLSVRNPADLCCVRRSGFPFLLPLLTQTCCMPVRKALEEDQKGKPEDHTIFSDAAS